MKRFNTIAMSIVMVSSVLYSMTYNPLCAMNKETKNNDGGYENLRSFIEISSDLTNSIYYQWIRRGKMQDYEYFDEIDKQIQERYIASKNNELSPQMQRELPLWIFRMQNDCLLKINKKTEKQCKDDLEAYIREQSSLFGSCCYISREALVAAEFSNARKDFKDQGIE